MLGSISFALRILDNEEPSGANTETMIIPCNSAHCSPLCAFKNQIHPFLNQHQLKLLKKKNKPTKKQRKLLLLKMKLRAKSATYP